MVNLFANGKDDCAKCPGFAAFSIYAHTLAACLAIDRLKDFLRWLVSTKRNSGGIYPRQLLTACPKEGAVKGNVLPGNVLLETKNQSQKWCLYRPSVQKAFECILPLLRSMRLKKTTKL